MKKRKLTLIMLAATMLSLVLLAGVHARDADDSAARETPREKTNAMKIRIKLADTVLTATLADNAAARDFIALLPLTLTLKSYADNEKIADLPKRLSTKDAPAGYDPRAGDITCYAPWGNLAMFYKEGRYSEGLVPLGKMDGDLEALEKPGALNATIELVK